MIQSDTTEARALEDELLVVRCQLGEARAFDQLIQRWHGPIWEYAQRQAGRDDAARDIVQEVWLRVFRGIAGLRDGRKLRAWLFGIARHTWMDHLRVRYALPMDHETDPDQITADQTPEDLRYEIATMRCQLARLPPIEREVLSLFYLQELSLNEVSQVLEVPMGTVKSRLFRARQLLRRELESEGVNV